MHIVNPAALQVLILEHVALISDTGLAINVTEDQRIIVIVEVDVLGVDAIQVAVNALSRHALSRVVAPPRVILTVAPR